MKKIEKNGVDIEYSDQLLDAIRKTYNKGNDEEITEQEIIQFVHGALENAVNKGVGEIE